jgi:hypothetical protein
MVGLGETGVSPAPLLSPAGSAPVPETEVQSPKSKVQSPDTSSYGATGTPIVSGFVTDLQEYNATLRGRNAFMTYEKMRRSDADVAALLWCQKLPIRSADCDVIPGVKENEPDYDQAKEEAKFVKENLFGGLEYENSLGMKFTQRWESVIENALLCCDFGCAGHEDLWTIDGDRVRLRRLAPRLPLTFYRFHVEPDGETLQSIEQWGYRGQQFVNVKVPADKFTLFSLHQEGANFYGISTLRFAYQPWYIKQALYRITSIAAERNAMGVPKITAALNPSKEDMDSAKQWVANLAAHENTGLALPNGWEMVFQGINGRIYDPLPFIQHCSEQIMRSGLAMFATLGTTQTGSRAVGNVMVDFFQMSLQGLASSVCDTISGTTIRRLVDFNFPRAPGKPLPYPKLIIPHIAVLNVLDLLAVIKDVAAANVDLIEPSLERDNWAAKKLGMPLLKEGQARIRYAPVAQRVTEEGANPQTVEEGGPKPQIAQIAPKTEGGKQQQSRDQSPPRRTQGAVPRPAALSEHATAGGRPLTRALKPHELKHDWDGHADRSDKTAAVIARILRAAKPALVREAAARVAKYDPATLDKLELPFPHAMVSRLARSLAVAHAYGRQAVYDERKKVTPQRAQRNTEEKTNQEPLRSSASSAVNLAESAEQDKPTLIAEASVSDLNNGLTSRARAAAVDAYKKGLEGQALEAGVLADLTGGADSWLDRIATEAARAAVTGGRWAAFGELQGEIARYARAEAMDQNTCGACAAGDGQEWESLAEVDWSPGDDCDGGDACRGQLMPIFSDEGVMQ